MHSTRNIKGRFTRRHAAAIIVTGLALGIILANYTVISPWLDKTMHNPALNAVNVPTAVFIATAKAEASETTAARIEAKKWQIVDDLAATCESKNSKEPDSLIIFDSNNQASIGAWQYQILTVIAYYKLHYNKTLTRTEAIALAINHEQARELTYKIIWDAPASDKGIDNWYNCAHTRSDFAARVQYIRQVEKDFISPITK